LCWWNTHTLLHLQPIFFRFLARMTCHQSPGKVVPVHAIKAYVASKSMAPLILNLSCRWKWVVGIRPRPL
jgi:hypothetical protein